MMQASQFSMANLLKNKRSQTGDNRVARLNVQGSIRVIEKKEKHYKEYYEEHG